MMLVDDVLGNVGGTIVRTRAERPWLEWGVVGDVMPFDRERERGRDTLVKHLMLLSVMRK
jgi:hypothetical protein